MTLPEELRFYARLISESKVFGTEKSELIGLRLRLIADMIDYTRDVKEDGVKSPPDKSQQSDSNPSPLMDEFKSFVSYSYSGKIPYSQMQEMRLVWFAGALTALQIMSQQVAAEPNEEKAVKIVDSMIQESVNFIKEKYNEDMQKQWLSKLSPDSLPKA